jgi:hypothetical protein
MNRNKFLSTLFDIGEETCFGTTIYDTALYAEAIPEDLFFSINPMHTSRADSNVTCFRNILIEIDSMPLEEQIHYVVEKVPVTSIVYSGGKSFHFIISLAQPCKDRAEYDTLVARIYKLLPMADKSTKNPSRFSRLPGVVRPDTGKLQHVEELYGRINRDDLENCLPPVEQKTAVVQQEGFLSSIIADAMFNPDAVMQKVGIQSRNAFFFWLGQRLKDGNASPEQKEAIVSRVYSLLKNKNDFTIKEAKQAARIK